MLVRAPLRADPAQVVPQRAPERLPVGHVETTPFAAGFQRDNLLLALAAARLVGAPATTLASALPALRGLPHRLDPLGEIDGRRLWDNAVSTTPDSTISALESLPEGTTLVVGGQVKDLPVEPLLAAARDRRARVVIFGAARERWTDRFRAAGLETREAKGPHQALALAVGLGDGEILISPACSSFDAYPNFQTRAREFLDAAEKLGLKRPPGRA